MADELRVRLLGGLDVEGVPTRELGSRKARSLLKLLALGRGAPVSADRLVDALWGDEPPARPVDQIGVLVSRLRPVLGPARIMRDDAGWSLEVDWLDVVELEARVDEAAARLHAGSHAAALAAARSALELVRGELLADEPDAPWAETERVAVARSIARARVIAADAALGAGQPDDAAADAERALDHDPYDEAALRVLMRAHTAAGRPASALAAYARTRARLAEDLGVDPVEETETLHTSILLAPAVDTPSRGATRRLVGRGRELDALDDALATAAAGDALAIVVEGEAGIGKTALLDAWAENLSTALVVSGRCDELGRELPLQPILDGLAAALRRLLPEETVDVGSLAPLLGRAGPPAAVAAANATTVVDSLAAQAALFAELLAVIERVAGDRTTVVVVEDVHLAGSSTMEWLAFAVRRGRRLLVVATTRPTDAVALPGARVVHVAPLDLDAVIELVGAEVGPNLLARSGGHPLFLVELANAGDGELPTSVLDAVSARVDQLGEAAATLRSTAILGATVDIDLLAGVLNLAVPVLLEHIDAGVRARIIAERSTSLVFRHELVREALVAGMSAARRAFVHREAARVLSDRPRRDPLDVAWHAQRGGDVETASAALVEAARIATDRYDAPEALRLLDRAIELSDTSVARLTRARVRIAQWDITGARADARAALQLGAGAEGVEVAAWAEYYDRDYDLALQYADEAIERADDDAVRASCLAMSGRVLHARGDLRDADERLTRAVASAPVAVRGFARVWLGGLRVHRGDNDQAIELVERGLVDGTWLGHPFAVHHAHFFRVLALGQLGRLQDAMAAVDVAREVAVAADDAGSRFVLSADNGRSWVLRSAGRVEEAEEWCTRVAESSGTTAQTMEMHCASLLDLVDGRLLVGDLSGAEAAIARATVVDGFHGSNAWHQRQRYGLQQARFALAIGDPTGALALASEVVDDCAARGSTRYELLGRAVLARSAPDAIDHDAVDAVLGGLESRAGLEVWLVSAELAAATGVDRWWREAERRAGALIAASGPYGETLRAWVASRFSALGR